MAIPGDRGDWWELSWWGQKGPMEAILGGWRWLMMAALEGTEGTAGGHSRGGGGGWQ